jgi:hypothetical protein
MRNARSSHQDVRVEDRVAPATGFAYVHCDVPTGMRLDEWRCARNRARGAAEMAARRERREALVANLRHCVGRR